MKLRKILLTSWQKKTKNKKQNKKNTSTWQISITIWLTWIQLGVLLLDQIFVQFVRIADVVHAWHAGLVAVVCKTKAMESLWFAMLVIANTMTWAIANRTTILTWYFGYRPVLFAIMAKSVLCLYAFVQMPIQVTSTIHIKIHKQIANYKLQSMSSRLNVITYLFSRYNVYFAFGTFLWYIRIALAAHPTSIAYCAHVLAEATTSALIWSYLDQTVCWHFDELQCCLLNSWIFCSTFLIWKSRENLVV